MSNKVDISFFARLKSKNKKNLVPIYARITVNSQRIEFSTGLSIEDKYWNGNSAKVVAGNQNAQLVNTYISTKKIEFKRIHNDLLLEQKEITANSIRNRLLGIKENEDFKTLIQLVDFHNTLFKSKIGTDTAITTYNKYKVTRKRLEEFMAYQYKNKDVFLKDLKLEFIISFDFYLKSVFKNNHNTVVKHCKNLKVVLSVVDKNVADEKEETHHLFDFLNKEQPTDDKGLTDGLGGLLPEAQGEDYDEQAFANRIRKKKKNKRPGRQ